MKTKIEILAFAVILTITACKKNDTGGKATIKGTVAHHSRAIPSATVYIKYGATEFPGSDVSVYNANVVAGADANYEIKSLRPGNYYVYAVGFDAAINEAVFGGVPVTIRNSEKKKTIDANIAVVE
jgi:hypothetical protein